MRQWRIQDLPGGGANSRDGCAILLFRKMFAENCVKIQECGPRGERVPSSARPLRLRQFVWFPCLFAIKVQFSESVTKLLLPFFLQNPLITATNSKGNVSDKCLTGRRNSLHLNSANCAFNWYNTARGGVCGDDVNLKSELSPTDKVVETDNWQCFYSI